MVADTKATVPAVMDKGSIETIAPSCGAKVQQENEVLYEKSGSEALYHDRAGK
jgi:hypothetical protein